MPLSFELVVSETLWHTMNMVNIKCFSAHFCLLSHLNLHFTYGLKLSVSCDTPFIFGRCYISVFVLTRNRA